MSSGPVEVTDWNELFRYVQFLCLNTEKKFKICMIDEEQEEIRIETKEEFDANIKYARDHGLKSITLIVYIDGERKFDGIYYVNKSNISKPTVFPVDKLKSLRDNVLVDKWYIPVKSDEALGICLTCAIKLAQEGKLDTNAESKEFVETIVPAAFRRLQTTDSVFSWPREIQYGTFEMIELLVDLVGTRLRYPPVPVTLLNTLAITFDTNTTFSQKHKDEQLPSRRSYQLDDEEFLRTNVNSQTGTYGWIRSFIQRFIAQNGLKNLRGQLEYINNSTSTTKKAMEYVALLKLFSKCYQCIDARRFRTLFSRPIRQAIKYLLDNKKTNTIPTVHLDELNEILIEICFNYEMNDEVNAILELASIPKNDETSSSLPPPSPITPFIVPTENKTQDCYERLVQDLKALTMNTGDTEQKSVKMPLFPQNHKIECTTDDLLSSSEKRSLKRKHRREQQRHQAKKEKRRSNTTTVKTYDRSNPDDILRFYAPMKVKIGALYDQLQIATCNGNLREVLKIEEKLKLLHPYSARFVADNNTPDGTKMQPGQVFRKGWILLNDGSMPWSNDDIQLINLSDGIKVVQQPVIPVTAPHDRALITVDFMCANEPGTYESKWILSYRHQTFGPMIWCSIEVDSSIPQKPVDELKDVFEMVDIQLPSCFDLSKPYQSTSDNTSVRSSCTLPSSNSADTQSERLVDILETPTEIPLLEITIPPNNTNDEPQRSPPSHQSFEFVDTVVTNIFSVAKQAGSTAKAIFHTLQATEETPTPTVQNTEEQNDFFEHVDVSETRERSLSFTNDPINILIEMGFSDGELNQRLLTENNNDLNKVIELLTDGHH